MSTDIPLIDISIQPIELCKLLKIANMVGGGGEAKIVISEGYVFVNGEVEFQKRKKVYQDDIIEFNGEVIQVNVVKGQTSTVNQSITVNKTPTNQNTANENLQIEQPRSKRKPISF